MIRQQLFQLLFSNKRFFSNAMAVLVLVHLSACSDQKPISDAEGDIKVQVPVAGTDNNKINRVILKDIHNLKNVSGKYVQFYYSPGERNGQITGGAPTSKFMRTSDGTYVPLDSLTLQMSALYYHIQSLTDFSAKLSGQSQPLSPFKIGLNTQIFGDTTSASNNAIFDGKTRSLLVVPYKLENTPISVNAGIIAHEFFHSLFYDLLLEKFNTKIMNFMQSSDVDTSVLYFNQTYVRGLNEGLADYWGWVYSNESDYISQSLPQFGRSRKLEMTSSQNGVYENDGDIKSKVEEAITFSRKPSDYLSNYIYSVGTPHARFLKKLTLMKANELQISTDEAKIVVAKTVYQLVKKLSSQVDSMQISDVLSASFLFDYYAQPEVSGLALNKEQCSFVLNYVDQASEKKSLNLCKGLNE